MTFHDFMKKVNNAELNYINQKNPQEKKNIFLWSIDECFLCDAKLTTEVEWQEITTKKGVFAICNSCCIDISEVI